MAIKMHLAAFYMIVAWRIAQVSSKTQIQKSLDLMSIRSLNTPLIQTLVKNVYSGCGCLKRSHAVEKHLLSMDCLYHLEFCVDLC